MTVMLLPPSQVMTIIYETAVAHKFPEVWYRGALLQYGQKSRAINELLQALKCDARFAAACPIEQTLIKWIDEGVEDRVKVTSPPHAHVIACELTYVCLSLVAGARWSCWC